MKTYTKLNKSAIKNLISNGWDKPLIACASQISPDSRIPNSTYPLSSGFFRDIPQFNKWCRKIQDKLCNETTGLTLKFYLVEETPTQEVDTMKPKIFIAHPTSIDYIHDLYNPLKESTLFKKYELILPHEHIPALDGKTLGMKDEHVLSKPFIKDSRYLIAEISNKSTGVGIELGWANAFDVEVICIHKEGIEPHAYMRFLTNTFIEYSSPEDLIKKLESKLIFKWNDAEMDGNFFQTATDIFMVESEKVVIQAMTEMITYESGVFCDWHYAAGKGIIKTQPDKSQYVISVISKMIESGKLGTFPSRYQKKKSS